MLRQLRGKAGGGLAMNPHWKPDFSIKIVGQRFDHVRVIQTPEIAEAEKHWSDLYIRYFSHPMTARLELEE